MWTKNIKETEHAPDGIVVLSTGLAIDMGKIKQLFERDKFIDIEYYDGTSIKWYPVLKDKIENETCTYEGVIKKLEQESKLYNYE